MELNWNKKAKKSCIHKKEYTFLTWKHNTVLLGSVCTFLRENGSHQKDLKLSLTGGRLGNVNRPHLFSSCPSKKKQKRQLYWLRNHKRISTVHKNWFFLIFTTITLSFYPFKHRSPWDKRSGNSHLIHIQMEWPFREGKQKKTFFVKWVSWMKRSPFKIHPNHMKREFTEWMPN